MGRRVDTGQGPKTLNDEREVECMKIRMLKFVLFPCLWVLFGCGSHEHMAPAEEPQTDSSSTIRVRYLEVGNIGNVLENLNSPEYLDSMLTGKGPNFSGWNDFFKARPFSQDTMDYFYSAVNLFRNRDSAFVYRRFDEQERQEVRFFLDQFFIDHRNLRFSDGYFVNFKMVGHKKYQILWGNEHFSMHSTDTFTVLGSGFQGPGWVSEKAMVFRQSCGTECFQIVILPKSPGIQETVLENPNEDSLYKAYPMEAKPQVVN